MSNPDEREALARNLGLLREKAEAYYRRSLEAYDSGDYENAILDISEAIYLDRGFPDFYATRGLYYLADLKFGEAEADLLYALKLNRKLWLANYGMGLLNFQQSEYDLALHYFAQAVPAAPRRPEVMYYLAVTEYYLGHDEKARDAMEQALKLFPPDDKRIKEGQAWLKEFGGVVPDEPKELKAGGKTARPAKKATRELPAGDKSDSGTKKPVKK